MAWLRVVEFSTQHNVDNRILLVPKELFLRLFHCAMRILLISGNGFIGRFAVSALTQKGHALAVFHRGTTAAPAGVEEIRGNRNQLGGSAQELKRFVPDVVIDFVISSGAQAEELMNIFRGATQRVVMLSSIDVYRAVGISDGTESGPLQEVPLTEESELRRCLHPYPPEGLQLMRKVFPWVTDDYDTPRHLLKPGNAAQHWTASSTRIRQELGYEESVTIEEAIRRTIRWERENPPAAALLAQFDYAAEDAAVAGQQPMSG